MANTPSAKKAARKIERRTAINKARRSRVRTQLRKVEEAIASGDKAAATDALKAAQPERRVGGDTHVSHTLHLWHAAAAQWRRSSHHVFIGTVGGKTGRSNRAGR